MFSTVHTSLKKLNTKNKNRIKKLTIVDIDGHGDFVKHSNSILQSFVISCRSNKSLSLTKKSNIISHKQQIKHQVTNITSADNRRMIIFVDEGFGDVEHFTGFNKN